MRGYRLASAHRCAIAAIVMIVALLMCLDTVRAASGDERQKMFREGNDAYKSGNYEKAIECYRTLVEREGIRSPQLYYNLGNACFKDNKPGYAIFYYEKAHRMSPREGDIRYNLDFAKKAVSKTLDLSPADGLQWIGNICTINELTVAASLFYLIFAILFIVYVFLKKDRYFWALCTSAFFFLFFSIFLGLAIYRDEALHYGVVVAPSAEVRSGPSLSESVSSIIPDGTVVRIQRTEEGWSEVLMKGSIAKDDPASRAVQGWVPEQDLKKI
jgi:hypothetical protein